jgi:hypothetical protein
MCYEGISTTILLLDENSSNETGNVFYQVSFFYHIRHLLLEVELSKLIIF